MNVSLIVTLAAAVYAVILGLIYMLKARKRSWVMSIVRLCVTVGCAIAAIFLTRMLAEMAADTVYELLRPYMGDEIVGFLDSVPVGAEGMRVLAALLVSPLLYLLVFLVLRWCVSLVVWIVEKCVPFLRRRSLRGVSMPLGALNGVLVAVVTLVPLCGYLMLCAHLMGTAVDSGILESSLVRENLPSVTEEEVVELADTVENHPVASGIYGTVGRPIFTALTTAPLDTTDTHGVVVELELERELCGILVMAAHGVDVMESFEKETYTAADKELLFVTADSLFASDWIRILAADTLAAMSNSWLENKDFAGIDRPALDASLNPTLNRLLEVLAAETPDTLEEDIHVILDVVGDLKVNGLLSENADYTAMVQQMGQSGLLTEMLDTLEESERLFSLAAELKSLAIRLVSNMLGVDKLQSGEYVDMMGNVASTLTDALDLPEAERDELILSSIKEHFAEQGFDVPDDVALKMSHQMIDELGADGSISPDELTEYMVNHAEEGFDVVGDVEIPDVQP